MTKAAHTVLNEALALSPLERASLIEGLFSSFGPDSSSEVDRLWAQEAESRIDAFEEGRLQASTLERIVDRVNRR